MKIAMKIGGSIAIGPDGPREEYFRKLMPVVNEMKKKHSLIIGIGGGGITRKYEQAVKSFSITDNEKEWLFVELIKASIRFVAYIFDGNPVFDLKDISRSAKLQVTGGIAPGRSTDANLALAAEKACADLIIILTDVDGVYTSDPKKNPDAKLLKKITFKELSRYAITTKPNHYGVIDPLAIKVIQRSKIRTVIANGRDPKIIERIIKGEKMGTVVE